MWTAATLPLKTHSELSYSDYCQAQQPSEDAVQQIQKDVPRTCESDVVAPHVLQRVLLAHAARNVAVGYTQGLNFVSASLLSALPPSSDEADAFWLLCTITERLLPDYYIPSLIGVRTDGLVLEALLHEHESLFDLPAIFEDAGFELGVITPHWLLLGFSETLPRDLTLRVWDLLFAFGSRVLLATALALLRCQAPRLRESSGFADLYALLRQPEKDAIIASELLSAVLSELHDLPATRVSVLRCQYRPRPAPPKVPRRYRGKFRARGGRGHLSSLRTVD